MSDFATPWTVASQAPLSMEFCWQEYWSGLPCPPPEDLPNPGIEPTSLAFPGELFFCLFVFDCQTGVFQKGCHTKGQGTMPFPMAGGILHDCATWGSPMFLIVSLKPLWD